MSKESKILLILVDPSQILMQDLVNINLPDLKGVRVIRLRHPYWGKHIPIQMFYTNSETITEFLNLEEFKAYFTEVKEAMDEG